MINSRFKLTFTWTLNTTIDVWWQVPRNHLFSQQPAVHVRGCMFAAQRFAPPKSSRRCHCKSCRPDTERVKQRKGAAHGDTWQPGGALRPARSRHRMRHGSGIWRPGRTPRIPSKLQHGMDITGTNLRRGGCSIRQQKPCQSAKRIATPREEPQMRAAVGLTGHSLKLVGLCRLNL